MSEHVLTHNQHAAITAGTAASAVLSTNNQDQLSQTFSGKADVSITTTPAITVSLPPLSDLLNSEKLQEIKAAELKELKDFC